MIGSLAQATLLMGVIYWYSKCMFSMINEYYREEFKKNVILPTPEHIKNSIKATEQSLPDETNEKDHKATTPTTPLIEGLPDILNENVGINRDKEIIKRDTSKNLNDKLHFDKQHLQVEHKEPSLVNDQNVNTKRVNKLKESNNINSMNVKQKYVSTENNYQPTDENDVNMNLCTEKWSKHETLLNSKKINYNQQYLKLPSLSEAKAAVFFEARKQEHEEREKMKNKLSAEHVDRIMEKNNNQNDGIAAVVGYNKAILNPSAAVKLNYMKISNQNPINVPNKQSVMVGCGTDDEKGNWKLPINQVNDKNRCNNMIEGTSKITIRDMETRQHTENTNNCENIDGNYSSKMGYNKMLNKGGLNPLKFSTNSKWKKQENPQEVNSCSRKSVSEYISFWSNTQF